MWQGRLKKETFLGEDWVSDFGCLILPDIGFAFQAGFGHSIYILTDDEIVGGTQDKTLKSEIQYKAPRRRESTVWTQGTVMALKAGTQIWPSGNRALLEDVYCSHL